MSQFLKSGKFTSSVILSLLSFIVAMGTLFYTGVQANLLQRQLKDTRKLESAKFVNNISHYLNSGSYNAIVSAIGSDDVFHDSKTPILKDSGGKFTEKDINNYISNFDSIANLWQEGLVDNQMAYNQFSYNAEKAWCNNDIRDYIISS